ncbi:MAG: glutathione ABC transporter substrate-binding protein [Armatimonadota bacterium]|nr:glutathione ABC transporter substrate-binding protein [Armatimonadota bacterium]MDR7538304.1 glutathione ABC transporter substrate-binding protein [Armatimonadota bacterium]
MLSKVLAGLIVLLVGTGAAGFAGPAPGEGIVIAMPADATALDPHKTNDGPSFLVINQIFETLLVRTARGLEPRLAISWRPVGDRTWEFKLRRGVRFHDGTPFNAEAVRFTIERFINPEARARAYFVLSMVEGVRAIADDTVQITTRYPFAALLNHLTHPATSIVSPAAVARFGADFVRNPVGTGPFKFESWVARDRITLLRNDDYWGGPPQIARVVLRPIPETSTQIVELESGGVDVVFNMPADSVARLERNPRIRVYKEPSFSANYIGFHLERPPFSDVRVRRAVGHAVRVEGLITFFLKGLAVRANGPLSPVVFGAHTDLPGYEYDLDRARALLTEAGVRAGVRARLVIFESAEWRRIAQAIQASLQPLGFQIEVDVVEFGTWLSRLDRGDFDLYGMRWGTVTLDADYTLYSLFHSSQIPNPNYSRYRNPEVDRLLDEGRATADQSRRAQIYRRAQSLIAQDAPMLFLYYPLSTYAVQSAVQNTVAPFSWINLDLRKTMVRR